MILKTFVNGTMTTIEDIQFSSNDSKMNRNDAVISTLRELLRLVIKRHQAVFYLSPKITIVEILNLRNLKTLVATKSLEDQIECNDSLWFVSEEDLKDFFCECGLDHSSIRSPKLSLLSLRQLQNFLSNYCDHQSFHLGSPNLKDQKNRFLNTMKSSSQVRLIIPF